MYDLTIIPGQHGDLTNSKDEYGEYGSVFASDEDRGIPLPLDFNPNPALDQTTALNGNSTTRVTYRVAPKGRAGLPRWASDRGAQARTSSPKEVDQSTV